MKTTSYVRMLSGLAVVSSILLGAVAAQATVVEKSKKISGMTVNYKVVLPEGYDANKAYPAIIAFGGGPQTMNTVDAILTRNLRAEAEKRGYIVFALSAPDGELYFEGGEKIFPEFLKATLGEYKIEGGKFHIAGVSNGGISALHLAAQNPEYYLSATAFPGFMWEATKAKMNAVSKMCVFMYVGENDEYRWHDEMQGEVEYLKSLGTVARYTVEKGQPHRIETLAGDKAARLFEGFEETKKGCSK